MHLPRHLFTPAFRVHHLGRSFAAIVGIMVFIATFAMAAEAGLLALGFTWGQTMESRLTVEIPAIGDEAGMSQAERVRQVISLLRAMPEVGMVMPLSDDEVERLLQPWFSEQRLLKALPLPTLIDVERKQGMSLTASQIQDSLKNVVSDAHVDDHGAWTQDVWRLIHGLSILGGLMIGLTAITLVITVSLTCRAVTAAERETISLLHIMGAEDRAIACHFQAQAERLTWRAAVIGFSLALMVTAALMFVTRHIADFSTLSLWHWGGLLTAACTVPVCAIALSTLTARLSVLRLLKTFP